MALKVYSLKKEREALNKESKPTKRDVDCTAKTHVLGSKRCAYKATSYPEQKRADDASRVSTKTKTVGLQP